MSEESIHSKIHNKIGEYERFKIRAWENGDIDKHYQYDLVVRVLKSLL